jgi:hypothetical protein
VSANAKALQSRQTNTTTLNINTNAVTKQSKTEEATVDFSQAVAQ